jgi:hypothetical protein
LSLLRWLHAELQPTLLAPVELLVALLLVTLLALSCNHAAGGGGRTSASTDVTRSGDARSSLSLAERGTTWSPGIPGGVPALTKVCAVVNASRNGNGAADASGTIQAALDACPTRQVVQLSAGTFLINDNHLLINRDVILRGAGPGVTVLKRTNGAKPGSYQPPVAAPVVIIGPNRWPGPDDSTARSLATDGVKGSYSVTLAKGNGFAAGQFVLLDEDNFDTGSWRSLPDRKANNRPCPAAPDRARSHSEPRVGVLVEAARRVEASVVYCFRDRLRRAQPTADRVARQPRAPRDLRSGQPVPVIHPSDSAKHLHGDHLLSSAQKNEQTG